MAAGYTKMEQLLNLFSLKSLITAPTSFKSVTSTCINLILTNHKQYFMKSQTLVIGISDIHTLTLTIMKNIFCNSNLNTKFYIAFDYTEFDNVFLLLLNKYALFKNKILRVSHVHL